MFECTTKTEKVVMVFLVVFIVLFGWVAVKKKQYDQQYIVQNDCKVTHEKQGTWIIGTNGNSFHIAGEKTYFCTKTQSSVTITD